MSCELDGRRDMDWFEKCPLPVVWQVGVRGCRTEKSLGSVRIHSQAKVEITTPLPSSGPEWLRSGDRFKVQGPASGPGGRFHRPSRFVFLISPLPAGHPDCRQPTPRGISFLFLNRGRPIWGSDLQQHPTSSLHRKRQAQDKSASQGLPVLTLDRSARRRLLDCSLA